MFLLDARICRDFLRGAMPGVLGMLQAHDPADIAVPTLVEAELRHRALKSPRPDESTTRVELFLAPFSRVSFDSAAATAYARVRVDLERKNVLIGASDLFSAAVALACDATLVTTDARAYENIRGLHVESWTEEDI